MWTERALRARSLANRYPASREILLFYAALAEWQGEAALRHATPAELLSALVDLVSQTGPPALRQAARQLDRLPNLDAPPPLSFFARAVSQVAHGSSLVRTEQSDSHCPRCHHPPQAGCLQTQGEAQALELVCSLCFTRWPFPRARCPQCGESAEGRLVLYSAPQFEHLRLQACETCHTYLQLVDLDRDALAIPEVDELAGLPLDLWAHEHGYHKLYPNLAGI